MECFFFHVCERVSVVCNLRPGSLSVGLSVLECSLGNKPERRLTGLFIGDLADSTGGYAHSHTQVRYHC